MRSMWLSSTNSNLQYCRLYGTGNAIKIFLEKDVAQRAKEEQEKQKAEEKAKADEKKKAKGGEEKKSAPKKKKAK